jgi:hypothetical protein
VSCLHPRLDPDGYVSEYSLVHLCNALAVVPLIYDLPEYIDRERYIKSFNLIYIPTYECVIDDDGNRTESQLSWDNVFDLYLDEFAILRDNPQVLCFKDTDELADRDFRSFNHAPLKRCQVPLFRDNKFEPDWGNKKRPVCRRSTNKKRNRKREGDDMFNLQSTESTNKWGINDQHLHQRGSAFVFTVPSISQMNDPAMDKVMKELEKCYEDINVNPKNPFHVKIVQTCLAQCNPNAPGIMSILLDSISAMIRYYDEERSLMSGEMKEYRAVCGYSDDDDDHDNDKDDKEETIDTTPAGKLKYVKPSLPKKKLKLGDK